MYSFKKIGDWYFGSVTCKVYTLNTPTKFDFDTQIPLKVIVSSANIFEQ